MILWGCSFFDEPSFEVKTEEEKQKTLKKFEYCQLLNLLINSDNPVIKSARNEALVAVKLVGCENYKKAYIQKEKHLSNEILRYKLYLASVASAEQLAKQRAKQKKLDTEQAKEIEKQRILKLIKTVEKHVGIKLKYLYNNEIFKEFLKEEQNYLWIRRLKMWALHYGED